MSKYRRKGAAPKAMTNTQVANYRDAYEAKKMTSRQIMEETGLSMNTVGRMLRRETYRDVREAMEEDDREMVEEGGRRLLEMQEKGMIGPGAHRIGTSADEMLEELTSGLSEEGKQRAKALGIAVASEPPRNPLDE